MIQGIGTDLCDIRRIEAVLARRGGRFAEKVLGPREIEVWRRRTARVPARGVRYLATRFAAKEAFSKAIGLGMRWPMTWRACEVVNEPGGRPAIAPARRAGRVVRRARLDRAPQPDRRGRLRRRLRGRRAGGGLSRARRDSSRPASPPPGADAAGPTAEPPTETASPARLRPDRHARGARRRRPRPRRRRPPPPAHPLAGGLILFGRNWSDRHQLVELTSEIKSLRPDMLICVDHEGGRVQRFRSDGYTPIAPMRALGERWMRDDAGAPGSGAMAAMQAATAAGYVIGAELRACGVDLSFTPVLDLDHGPSGVIGDRAFHRDPRVVAMLARALMQGLLRAGMASCGKHFPGHGHARGDSHHEEPVDERSLKRDPRRRRAAVRVARRRACRA